ncbi:MAG: phosphoribosylformylglycinamidine synthase subunit PurQ [Spirochaetota bacterium]
MKIVRSLVITGFGINCEEEMAAAYLLSGAEAVVVHLNDILVEGFSIHDFDIINFPGGFSFGDDIASGRVLANKIKYRKLPNGRPFIDEIRTFIENGKYIFGVCNGFQVLVKLGLLPGISGGAVQDATLTRNDSSRFEDRWCRLVVQHGERTPFLSGISDMHLPVRHGEGKLVFRNDIVAAAVLNGGLDVMAYANENGNPASGYPENPNGSQYNVAALTDITGQVFGMMPHPEAALTVYNDPQWGKMLRENPDRSHDGDGLAIFKNIVNHIKETRT